MRFISQHRGYELALRGPGIGSYTLEGQPIYNNDKVLNANFRQGGASPWEIEEALKHWDGVWSGLAEGVDPRSRLSVFDTEWAQLEYGWTDADREFAEDRLLNLPGRLGNEYIVIEEHKAPIPWPTYKTFNSPERIVAFMREAGYEPESVLRYERENANREEVLTAVEDAGNEDVVEHEVVVKA
jgi:hypothetical protein